VYQRQC